MEDGGVRPAIRAAWRGPTDPDWDGYRKASHVGVGAIAALTVLALLSLEASPSLVPLGVGLAAAIVLAVRTAWVPSLFNLVFVLTLLVDGAGFAWGLFEAVLPYDEISHGLTAMALTLAAGFPVYRPLADGGGAPRVAAFLLALFSLGMTAGAAWEVFEWYVGIEMSLHDTITDLVADALGAAIALPIAYGALRRRSRETAGRGLGHGNGNEGGER